MGRSQERRPSGSRAWAIAVAFAVVVGGGIAISLALRPSAGDRAAVRGASPAPHYVGAGEDTRTLIVQSGGAEHVSPAGGPLYSTLLAGAVPARAMMATVLTDTNCAPDAEGVSHCENRLRLADGSVLLVQHNHRMAEVPCLTPGERVVVTAVPL